MIYSALGVVFGMIGLYITAIQAPHLPPKETSDSSSSTTNHLESIKPVDDSYQSLSRERITVAQNLDKDSKELFNSIPTGNSVVPEFPQTISQPMTDSEQIEYKLLGLGVRTVSFLKIQVYVVGIYVATDDISILRNFILDRISPLATSLTENERNQLSGLLRDPDLSEKLWDTVLRESKCRMIIRIVPTRNTDFGHLRDGWVRGLTTRAQMFKWQDEEFGRSMSEFKKIFARGSVPKGQELTLLRGKASDLSVWYTGEGGSEYLGRVSDERISRALWLGYLAGKTVACEDARQNVIASLKEILK